MTTPTQRKPESGHDSGTDATDAMIRKKYFLVPKRPMVIGFILSIVLYLFVFLSSEFVYSVSTSTEGQIAQFKDAIQKIPCSPENYRVVSGKVPKRNPWLLERYGKTGAYMEILVEQPGCASLSTLGALAGPYDKFVDYYFDRATDKPVIKVTYESLK